MQKLQESVFSILKTTSLSPAVFSFLQPTEDSSDKTPLGGILRDTKYGWLALGPKFCVVDLRSGLKVAARTFGNGVSSHITVTSVVELPTSLTENSQQLIISLECDETTGLICVFHINGSQLLRCIQTDVVVTELTVCDTVSNGPLTCFDGLVMAGTRRGEIFVFDLNRACLIQALKDISQGYEQHVRGETNAANIIFLPLQALHKVESQRDLAVENDDHLAVLLNENSFVDGQYIFRNPDGTVRMKAKQNHIRATVVQYIPQLGSLAVGYNFGAFQIWNLLNLELEFTSQVNVECLPVTHFGFQEPCDDPRAFCYLWVVFSVIDRFEEEEFPLAVMYSLTYQGKRMLSDTQVLYQEFSMATLRFQIELGAIDEEDQLMGGRCISCHTYSISSTLGEEGEDTMLNLCQLVWECWGENSNSASQHGMLLFDLDQWYKDQMPATYRLENNAFMSVARCPDISRGSCLTLDLRLDPMSVSPYSHATRLEEHFYPNSLQYNCICLNTSEASTIHTVGVQRQTIRCISSSGPGCLLSPARIHAACLAAGLAPLYCDTHAAHAMPRPDEQRRFLLSVALEARLSGFLKRCAHDWATGTHSGVGCTLPFLVDWSWKRAIELKENAKELTAPLFTSSTMPDRNVVRCLEHCVQQLTQLTGFLDAVLTKCCNLVVPDALSEMEEKYKGVGTVSLYFQVVQWFLRVGLLPERQHFNALPYPHSQLHATYNKRRTKLNRLHDKSEEESPNKSCPLLYIDQLIEHEFDGETVHQMWIKGGGESGLYPPPSLYSLLRLYLLPRIADEHKHSLVLYLLLDYSMLYDDMRYEAVIRRLMQFPTMFGLSNTAIKATQAFWHLDHRDFDFALDQLQCLTGNTLSDWQHHVVLSSLLAQKKTQAALQYLHVRKPAPIQNINHPDNRVNDHDKLDDWQSSCDLYLARGLVFEALDVIRMCVQNAGSASDKMHLLNYFFKGCRNTGQLSKVLQVTLMPSEEDAFIKYLKECNETQTSDILIMYYLQQARYLEAEQFNNKIKSKGRVKDITTSAESLLDVLDRESARDTLVEIVCSSLPSIANSVARCALTDFEPHIIKPKPMSVFVQAKSPKNTFTYKSSFIQDTIENASETWMHKPKMRKGLKRALEIEDTPFICTPKLYRTKSIFGSEQKQSESTPPKRARLDLSGALRTPRTPKTSALPVSDQLSRQMAELLDMPLVQSPSYKHYEMRPETPHSILKNRRLESQERGAPSPVDSRYLGDSDDELLETASNHTHYSDKHLRFTIPTASEGGSTPSPVAVPVASKQDESPEKDSEVGGYDDTKDDFRVPQSHPMESPPKKFAAEEVKSRKSYKDNVRARRSLSISANSSLSDDPNTSIESIADLPVTLINPRYSGEKKYRNISLDESKDERVETRDEKESIEIMDSSADISFVPKTPKGRMSIRSAIGESTPLVNKSRSATPERMDSPTVTPMRARSTRSRSRTPEISPRASPLAPILEQPKQEVESEPHPAATTLSVPRPLRSRSRTPERQDALVKTSPRLEAIKESPTKPSESPVSSPTRRSLRSRSRTPEVETPQEQPVVASPRSLRSRSKTPEKLMSPKKEHSIRSKKSLSRMVLEANTFAKTKQQSEKMETENIEEKTESFIECTPMKPSKETASLMDVTFSPIVNKSVLQSSSESIMSMTTEKMTKSDSDSSLKPLPGFTTINEIYIEKSVLHSYQSSVAETSSLQESSIQDEKKVDESAPQTDMKSLPAFTTINEDFGKSVLHSFESSIADSSIQERDKIEMPKLLKLNESDLGKSVLGSDSSIEINAKKNLADSLKDASSIMTSDSEMEVKDWKDQSESQDTARDIQKEKERIVEIEREIHEIEGEMSDECRVESDSEEVAEEESEESAEEEEEESSDENTSDEESDNEVISIQDSDDSSDANKLQIDEQTETKESEIIEEKREVVVENIIEVNVEKCEDNDLHKENSNDTPDQLNQAQSISLMTDDNSVVESDQSVSLNYSDEKADNEEKKDSENKEEPMETGEEVQIQIVVEEIAPETEPIKEIQNKESVAKDIDVVDAVMSEPKNPIKINEEKNNISPEIKTGTDKKEETTEPVQSKEKEAEDKVGEQEKSASSRKRTKSTSSTKSKEAETEKVEEPKTPSRKRTQSTASNKSEAEVKTPENTEASTPSRRRAKTPTSTEVRKILTRRASKELSEKVDDDSISVDEVLTPRRRSTRSRSKKDDDNVSITSESSVISTRSKASEEVGDVKPAPIRKGRKSILSTKPDLSVIPEIISEESKLESNEDIANEYSSSRRLTRHQKAVLDSWLEPKTPPRTTRRGSVASRSEMDDDDASSTHSELHGDRASVLSRQDYEGSSDVDDLRHSPDSIAANPKARLARAASESKAVPKAARITRRGSVDVVATPESPGRSRRASFNRACEALHTPKGRRTSTDKKSEASEAGSPVPEPEPATPGRRPRRASTQSNSSQKSDTGRRSRKPAAEKSKE